MESAAQVAAIAQKRKRMVKPKADKAKVTLAGNTSESPVKKTRQTKNKNPLLKIYNESVVSVDILKDLGAISHFPMGDDKEKLTINFKYKKHEPIVICVKKEDVKSVKKKICDFAKKYSNVTTGDDNDDNNGNNNSGNNGGNAPSDDDDKIRLVREMKMYEAGAGGDVDNVDNVDKRKLSAKADKSKTARKPIKSAATVEEEENDEEEAISDDESLEALHSSEE